MIDGDNRFIGLDMRRDPSSVAEGFYITGEHVECEDGTVKTRPGNLMVPWADTYRYDAHYTIRATEKHGNIIDAIRFADTDGGRDYLLLLTTTKAVLCLPGSTAQEIALPVAYTPSPDSRLIQAFNKVYLLGGEKNSPLSWSLGDDAFERVDTGELVAGYEYMPRTRRGCYHQNRIWVVTEGNRVLPSDILEQDFKSVDEFYVNQGDSDTVKALVPYTDNRIIAFKENSMYSLDNLVGTLDSAEINLISNNIGISGDRSAQVIGQNLIWLSRKGVMLAQLAYEQRITPDTVPLSEPIEPVIERINWGYVDKAVSAIHNERYYLAVPLDGNTENSAVLVFNFKNQAWESIDDYDLATFEGLGSDYIEGFAPQSISILGYGGKEVCVCTSKSGGIFLYRFNEGKQDRAIETADSLSSWLTANSTSGSPSNTKFSQQEVPFTSVMETRGYLAGDATTKLGARIELTVDTYNPEFDIEFISAGPGEGKTLVSGKTRDRTKRRDYANSGTTTPIDNEGNEHQNPYLDDYSIHLESTYNSQTTSAYPEFYFGDATRSPVWTSRPQEFVERYRIYKRCRAPRVKIKNGVGYLKVKGVRISEYTRNRNNLREV